MLEVVDQGEGQQPCALLPIELLNEVAEQLGIAFALLFDKYAGIRS